MFFGPQVKIGTNCLLEQSFEDFSFNFLEEEHLSLKTP